VVGKSNTCSLMRARMLMWYPEVAVMQFTRGIATSIQKKDVSSTEMLNSVLQFSRERPTKRVFPRAQGDICWSLAGCESLKESFQALIASEKVSVISTRSAPHSKLVRDGVR